MLQKNLPASPADWVGSSLQGFLFRRACLGRQKPPSKAVMGILKSSIIFLSHSFWSFSGSPQSRAPAFLLNLFRILLSNSESEIKCLIMLLSWLKFFLSMVCCVVQEHTNFCTTRPVAQHFFVLVWGTVRHVFSQGMDFLIRYSK